MQKRKLFLGTALAIFVMAFSAVSVFAASEESTVESTNFDDLTREERREQMEARREAVMTAIESGDYDQWYQVVTEDGMTSEIIDVINADNFAQFSEAHKLIDEGRDMLEELGVDKGMGMDGIGKMHRGKGGYKGECLSDDEAAESEAVIE